MTKLELIKQLRQDVATASVKMGIECDCTQDAMTALENESLDNFTVGIEIKKPISILFEKDSVVVFTPIENNETPLSFTYEQFAEFYNKLYDMFTKDVTAG